MDESIVLMLRDSQTGHLSKELGVYNIGEYAGIVDCIYAVENSGQPEVILSLTCDRDVLDWEFNAIYDYYDVETFSGIVSSIKEAEECYNPTWTISIPFFDNASLMQKRLYDVCALHKQELYTVYEAISDKRNEYIDES